ncbi:rho GTPase-activating protein 15 isoform X3 [Ornithorhynchus anatinus]|uniref:Rho GTPase-activating protein 15 n=1 Tax=Ornithorhynchus anatinus TaxID=9258 RepID=F7AQ95_ORNAN|nr:rho GTPase-activating protein 15 isoform X3 [Ornithorhynchus anatinus]
MASKPISAHQSSGAVQMRIKNANSHHDRLSQSKSMILSDGGKVIEPISRHRRNQSQHILKDNFTPLEQLMVVKEGYLQKAKIADAGKKLRKNWSTSWIVLSPGKIEFHKETKPTTGINLKTGHKAEMVDLCGAQIEWTPEKSSKKNVFQITTVSGNEFLLQSDIDFIISDWFHAIKNAIDKLPKNPSCGSQNRDFKIQRSSSTELLSHIDPEVREQKPEHRKSLIFRLNHSLSDINDKNRTKSRLKKFITRRPSLKTLQEKGLIKGLDADGIYRVSGNLATIQKLRFIVNQEEKLNLDDSQWEDIHVVTGALKMFFRELLEPLFPFCFFERFMEAIKKPDHRTRVESVKDLVRKLPPPNRDTMSTLFAHLQKIVANASKNLMSTQSLGIVFGPTLLWPEKETGNIAVHMVYQNQVAELMLSDYSEIFSVQED